MTNSHHEQALHFRSLHRPGQPLVLPNAWDAASARLIEEAGAAAIATTSAGVAWSIGAGDGEAMGRDRALDLIARVASTVSVPVSADIEGGYAEDPDGIAETIRRVLDAGAVGVNLEDGPRPAAEHVEGLRSYFDVPGDVPLAELHTRVAAVASACSEAVEALRNEVSNSEELRVLPQTIDAQRLTLKSARGEAEALDAARKVLDDLFANASLESATQDALEAIGDQINEVFSRIHSPKEYEYVGSPDVLLRSVETQETRTLTQVSTGQRAAFALSIFLARNRTATNAPPILLIDDPIAHIDDLNALSFLDYLRDLAVNSGRQIFFATADTKVASLFSKKFSFLGDDFKTISLVRESRPAEAVTGN